MRWPNDGPWIAPRDIPARIEALIPRLTRWRIQAIWIMGGLWRRKPVKRGY